MSSEATDPADRLAQIKARVERGWTFNDHNDVDWLLAEVERLRAALADVQRGYREGRMVNINAVLEQK